MRISDWSSDVCSSDLALEAAAPAHRLPTAPAPPRPAPIVDIGDAQHRHLRHPAHPVKRATGSAVDQSLVAHVAQQLLERDLVMAPEAERARDFALPRRLVGALDEIENLLAGRESRRVLLGHPPHLAVRYQSEEQRG